MSTMNTVEISIRRLLNRLSESNITINVRNVIDIIKDNTDNNVPIFINSLFEKCMTEPNFIHIYVIMIYEVLVRMKP